ncbi:mobile mystery protein B [bacterium]|nr:mobile mystery protein B [bacterium]
MPKFKVIYPSGATPIEPDGLRDLIPDYISTMSELNQAEQSNIADGFVWAEKQIRNDLLNASFTFKLHKKMFDQVWRWAGTIRRTNTNIGVAKENIMSDLAQLLENTRYWMDHNTYEIDEIAARFHRRLVEIHVFPNGNGRHARLMTNLILQKTGVPKFTWGTSKSHTPLEVEGRTRSEYISALKKADRKDFEALIIFARS